ncbi:MAG TPA: barstar family protein [Dongiaceae bacterium]
MRAPVRFVPASSEPALREELAQQGLALAAFDGAAISDGPALLKALGQALTFPPYYGANWDAAEECLRDLGERYPSGCSLLVDHAGRLWQRLPRKMGQLVSLWLTASTDLAADGIPLQLIFLLESKS